MKLKDQTRNLHPTPQAEYAMIKWHTEYAAQDEGSMDFYDSLTDERKEECENAVKDQGSSSLPQ